MAHYLSIFRDLVLIIFCLRFLYMSFRYPLDDEDLIDDEEGDTA